jgi:hypothetical protein
MCNPSTADAERDDPTIRRCVRFARRWGYGGIVVRNLYALRTPHPRELRRHPDPIGVDNDTHLMAACGDPITVCAWGSAGPGVTERGEAVLDTLAAFGADLRYLALTRAGAPRHPLYLPGHLTPIPFGSSTPSEGSPW